MKHLIPTTVIVAALTVGACGASTTEPSESSTPSDVTVVATTTMLGDVTKQITDCGGGTTTTLMPAGTDPHDFSASAKQAAEMSKSTLIVANGLGLEGGLSEVLESAEKDGASILEVATKVDPIDFSGHAEEGEHHDKDEHAKEGDDHAKDHAKDEHDDEGHKEEGHAEEGHDKDGHAKEGDDHAKEGDDHAKDHAKDEHDDEGHEEEGHEHHHGDKDPHFWHDADKMAVAATVIGDTLTQKTGKAEYGECGAKVSNSMKDLAKEITETLSGIPQDKRVLITDHDAFGYFAKAHDFEVLGVVIPGGSTEAKASSGDIAKLVKIIKEHKVHVIFSNTSTDDPVVKQIADEAGQDVKVIPLLVGTVGEGDAGSYAGMMRANAKAIADALK